MQERPLYYHRDGTPCKPGHEGMMEFAAIFEAGDDTRRVARTKLWWGGYVSTVFLGLDHSFLAGPPLIFETMVFRRGSWSDLAMNRYPTESDAVAGHNEMVRRWSNPFSIIGYFVANLYLGWDR